MLWCSAGECILYLFKNKIMHKYILMLVFALTIISCGTDTDAGDFVVGSDYLAINNKVILIDTVTVEMSTINFDSLVTSSQSRILIGNYDDPLFGKIKSNSYFELATSNYTLQSTGSDTESVNYVFDSISMILKYNNYYYGDTTKVQTFDIHRITQKVKPNIDDKSFYNNSALSYSNESLGTISYKPRPIEKDSINIKMDPVFGEDLFLKIKNREITGLTNLTEYLKGLVLVPSTSNSSSVIGFNTTTSVVRMYYSKYQSEVEKSFYIDFNIQDITKQFNSISSDKTGTLIQNLPVSTNKLSSSLTNRQGFIQSGAGVACRIDFPNIKQLKYISEKGAIVDAQLILKPVNNSYSEQYPLEDSLHVYVADNLNRISGTLTNSAGSLVYGLLNKKSDEFNENIGYTVSVGGFLQKEMWKQSDSKSSLILTLPGISKSVNRIVLGDQKHLDNKIQLKVYYISY
jgi:predicted transcriptional regulator